VPWVGFLLSPILAPRREQWRAVGRVSGFSVGDTVEVTFRDAAAQPWSGASGDAAAWLRRDAQNRFTAFSIHCTHLGCPVRWEQGANLFMCPCHGGVFYADGSVAAGPPPRALTRFPVRVADGQVYVRTIGLPVT
jgi:menaquinol-cytochrome c reductase iron-sulfur subunit